MAVTITNISPVLSPSGFPRTSPISFDVESDAGVIDWVSVSIQYTRDSKQYVIFEGDVFTESYDSPSTVGGLGTTSIAFSLFEFGGWRDRIYKIQVTAFSDDTIARLCPTDVLEPVLEFSWSGTFPYPALTSTELITYLDMAVLAEDSSHLWQFEAMPTTVDIGSLATSQFDLFGPVAPGTIITDPGYRLGAGNVVLFDDRANEIIGTANSQNIPSAMDGTKSFIVGGICQVDSFDVTQVNNILVHKYNNSTIDGWFVSSWNDTGGGGQARWLRFTLNQGGTLSAAVSPVQFVLGEPFAFVCALDVAAGEMQIMTSVAGSYGSTAYTDVGNFDVGAQPLRIGKNSIPGLGDTEGVWAQLFTLEWDPSINAGLSEEKMTNFLKYCDGFLTV